MENESQTFQEQDHPLKNTDDAFVQVGKNGEPLVPRLNGNESAEQDKQGKDAPLVYDKP